MKRFGDIFSNKIVKNASWIIVCRVLQSLLSVVIAMLTARYLGPSNFGVVNYAASLTAFFAPIMYLGFNSTIVQELVLKPEDDGKIMGTAMGMSLMSALLCMLGVTAFVSVANPNEPETLLVCALYSTLLIFQAVDLLQYWYQYKYMSKIASIAMLVSYAAAAVYKIVLLVSGRGVVWFSVANSIEYMLIAMILYVMYRRKGGKPLTFSWNLGTRMVAKSWFYILSSLMVTLYSHMGKVCINLLLDEASTGYYSAAVAVITMTSFVFMAIVDSFRPEVLKHTEAAALDRSMIQLFAVVFYVALLQCLGIVLLAKPIVYILYGAAYAPAVGAVQVGIWYTIVSYMAYARGVWVLAKGLQKYLWILNLVGAVTNITLNILLIPIIGIVGAAAASVLTETVTNIIVPLFFREMRPVVKLMLKSVHPRHLIQLIKR